MIRLEMKNWSTILIEKQPKYQLYHQKKLESINEYLTGEEILPSNQQQIKIYTYDNEGTSYQKISQNKKKHLMNLQIKDFIK